MATPQVTDQGPIGKPLQMDAAHIAAIKRAIFARPARSNAPISQTTQGLHGAVGAPHGRPNGFIGAAVPQMGTVKTPGAAPASQPAQPAAQPGLNAPGPATGAGGGLAALMPLLHLFGPLLMHLFGGGGLGGAGGGTPAPSPMGTTPRGGGLV
jgi:hypothetical protein